MKTCPICNKDFKQITASHIKTHGIDIDKFKIKYPYVDLGNDGTRSTHLNKRMQRMKSFNKRCLECGTLITSRDFKKQKFCCKSHATTYHNKKKDPKYEKQCLFCKKMFKRHRKCGPYCSPTCVGEHKKQKIYMQIENGSYFELGFSEETMRQQVRKYLIAKNGHKCVICKNTKWKNEPIPLVCDHIDGYSQNNQLNNFRLVCENCNALLPTYKSKNNGKGRKSRKSQTTITE